MFVKPFSFSKENVIVPGHLYLLCRLCSGVQDLGSPGDTAG